MLPADPVTLMLLVGAADSDPVNTFGSLLLSGGFGAVLATIVAAVINRRKLGADTASILSKTAIELVQPLRDRVKELEEQLDRVGAKATALERALDDCRDNNRRKDDELAVHRRRRDRGLYAGPDTNPTGTAKQPARPI